MGRRRAHPTGLVISSLSLRSNASPFLIPFLWLTYDKTFICVYLYYGHMYIVYAAFEIQMMFGDIAVDKTIDRRQKYFVTMLSSDLLTFWFFFYFSFKVKISHLNDNENVLDCCFLIVRLKWPRQEYQWLKNISRTIPSSTISNVIIGHPLDKLNREKETEFTLTS